MDKTDAEVRDLRVQFMAQNQEQQHQIKATILVLEEVHAQQTPLVTKLHATVLLWQSGSHKQDQAQTSN